ncbi:unnamed protein product [Ascophyllum nodosum]
MAAGENGSSEEVVEDESGEDAEGESSASFESEDDEDNGFGGGESDAFETPQKAKKRPRVSEPSASLVSKSSSKKMTAPPAKTAGPPKPAPKAPSTSAATKKSPPPQPPGKKGKGKAASSEALSSTGEDEIPPTPGAETAKGSPASTNKSTPSEAMTSHTPKSAVSAASKSAESASEGGQGAAVAASGGAKTPKGAVSDYMMRSNRPFSCINVFDNLHKKIPKAMIQKLLDELTRDGTLKVQEYSKARIYYANQDALPGGAGEVSDEKLGKLEQEAKDLTSKLEVASAEARAMQARVQALAAQPTDTDLDDKLASTARDVEQMEARNAAIKAQGHGASTGEGGMKAARAGFNKFRALWVKRKRNAMDVVDMIADGMDKKPKVIMDMLDLEPDEDPIPPKM